MNKYAIEELQSLIGKLPKAEDIDDSSPQVRYLCALFAELAYHHIPQWEIDDPKRAKLIPCAQYRTMVATGHNNNAQLAFNNINNDNTRLFVVEDRGVVAVGLVQNSILFIGFRGTQFLFDWKINLRSKLVPVNNMLYFNPPFFSKVEGRFHSGFAEESIRVSKRILDATRVQSSATLNVSS